MYERPGGLLDSPRPVYKYCKRNQFKLKAGSAAKPKRSRGVLESRLDSRRYQIFAYLTVSVPHAKREPKGKKKVAENSLLFGRGGLQARGRQTGVGGRRGGGAGRRGRDAGETREEMETTRPRRDRRLSAKAAENAEMKRLRSLAAMSDTRTDDLPRKKRRGRPPKRRRGGSFAGTAPASPLTDGAVSDGELGGGSGGDAATPLNINVTPSPALPPKGANVLPTPRGHAHRAIHGAPPTRLKRRRQEDQKDMHNNLDEIKGASPKTSVAPATASSALDVIGKTEKKKKKKKKYRKKKGSTSSNRAGSAHVCDRCAKVSRTGALGGHKSIAASLNSTRSSKVKAGRRNRPSASASESASKPGRHCRLLCFHQHNRRW